MLSNHRPQGHGQGRLQGHKRDKAVVQLRLQEPQQLLAGTGAQGLQTLAAACKHHCCYNGPLVTGLQGIQHGSTAIQEAVAAA